MIQGGPQKREGGVVPLGERPASNISAQNFGIGAQTPGPCWETDLPAYPHPRSITPRSWCQRPMLPEKASVARQQNTTRRMIERLTFSSRLALSSSMPFTSTYAEPRTLLQLPRICGIMRSTSARTRANRRSWRNRETPQTSESENVTQGSSGHESSLSRPCSQVIIHHLRKFVGLISWHHRPFYRLFFAHFLPIFRPYIFVLALRKCSCGQFHTFCMAP